MKGGPALPQGRSRSRKLFIAVPGRNDRAFYKMFIKEAAYLQGLTYYDLDAVNRLSEKKAVLKEIAPSELVSRGVSIARLKSDQYSYFVDTVIWPMEGERGEPLKRVRLLLSYQLGLDKPTLDYLVVVRDIENQNGDTVVQGIVDGLSANHQCIRSSRSTRGRYFVYVQDVCGKGINLLALAQGLEHLHCLPLSLERHALEDFVIYLSWDKLKEYLQGCSVLREIVRGRYAHKKLAALAAIDACRPSVDEAFFRRIINRSSVEKLCRIHDGLNALCNLLRFIPGLSSRI